MKTKKATLSISNLLKLPTFKHALDYMVRSQTHGIFRNVDDATKVYISGEELSKIIIRHLREAKIAEFNDSSEKARKIRQRILQANAIASAVYEVGTYTPSYNKITSDESFIMKNLFHPENESPDHRTIARIMRWGGCFIKDLNRSQKMPEILKTVNKFLCDPNISNHIGAFIVKISDRLRVVRSGEALLAKSKVGEQTAKDYLKENVKNVIKFGLKEEVTRPLDIILTGFVDKVDGGMIKLHKKCPGAKVDQGYCMVLSLLDTYDKKIYTLTIAVPNSNSLAAVFHPAVSHAGNVCVGAAYEMVTKALDHADLEGVLALLKEVLRTATAYGHVGFKDFVQEKRGFVKSCGKYKECYDHLCMEIS